ncbi:MAG: hypothetical protein JXO72_03195 [Vicinamibacteria bacterium]|nr:hypothetical protein [Vicinamibacteria bacterium]
MKRLINTTLTHIAVLFFLSTPAVPAPIAGFELVAETEHFAYYSRSNRRLKIDARRCERFLQETARLLGVTLEDYRWSYYRHSHPVEVAFHAGPFASVSTGITDPAAAEVHSVLAFHPHELVHVVSVQLGDPGRFFHEGLAVVLGDKAKFQGRCVHALAKQYVSSVDPLDLIRDFENADPATAYSVAGSFVDYIIKKYGIKKISDYFKACRPVHVDRIAAFEQVFGDALPRVVEQWPNAV